MKKILLGVIIGILISTSAFAASEYILKPITYDIKVDGISLKDPQYPILNLNGTTYLSLKKTTEVINAKLNWNKDTNTAELITKETASTIEKGKNISFPELENTNGYKQYSSRTDVKYIIKDNKYYVYVMLFADYAKRGDGKIIINWPNKINNISTESIIVDGSAYISISDLGLKGKIENDTLIIE